MTKPKQTIKWVAISTLASLLVGFAVIASLLYAKFNPLPWDIPNKLSGVIDTIDIWDIQIACDCAEWGIIGEEKPEENSIFIEAAPGTKMYEEGDSCWAKKLKLIGQFYVDQGISRDYDIMFEKPEKARVFRYDSYVITELRCIGDSDEL